MVPIKMVAEIRESQKLLVAESKVDSLYQDLVFLSNTNTSNDMLSEIRYKFDITYFKNKDQNCPNEFKSIWSQNPDVTKFETDIRPDRYVNLFCQFFHDSKLSKYTFEYKQLKSCIVHAPEFKGNEEPAKLAQVLIQKTYLQSGKSYITLIDTLVIGLEEMKIRAWANETSRHPIGYFSTETSNIETMLLNAKLAYSNKQYDRAYQIYETITSRHPYEGEAYYRMAVMLNDKDAGANMSKRKRNQLILEYLNKAIKFGGYPIKKYAEIMKYWLIS